MAKSAKRLNFKLYDSSPFDTFFGKMRKGGQMKRLFMEQIHKCYSSDVGAFM